MRRSLVLGVALIVGSGLFTLALFALGAVFLSEERPSEESPTQVAQIPLRVVTEATATASQSSTITPTLTTTPTETPSPIIVLPTDEPTITLTPSITATWTIVPTLTPRSTATLLVSSPAAQAASQTEAEIAAVSTCPPPEGWERHVVAAGETLFAFQLGVDSTVTVATMVEANCLEGSFILEGQVLWLPPGAVENAPSSEAAPTPLPAATFDPAAPPPSAGSGITRPPQCPCQVIIQQGLRLEQIAELIDSLPVGFRGADLKAITIGSLPPREIFNGAPAGATLEGYLLPGSYTVTNEMGAQAFAELVLSSFEGATAGIWGDAAARGLSPYHVVTLASIINKESRSANQQVMISSVFHNRLKDNGVLGASVTTAYALGRAGNWWPDVSGRVSTYNSPYNTNIYEGLPPTPIASATADALRAAAYPSETNYYYFTGNCRGSGNVFAETYEQHLANVRCE